MTSEHASALLGSSPAEAVLDIRDLTVRYGQTTPVDGVSFTLHKGERIGLVGESGSGKSLTALAIMRLAEHAKLGGVVNLGDVNLLTLSQKQMTRIRGGKVAMVYQDPMSSLNPVMTIGHQLTEAIRLHSTMTKASAHAQAIALLDEVGVPFPEERMKQYAHEFSGGMRQRVMIAMAMSGKPDVLIADEPTTALDVTTQSVIIDLLDRLANDYGTAVVLITHDLGVAAGFCETIHVMRHGKIVESAPAIELYENPQNDYSKILLKSVVDLTIDVTKPIPTGDDVLRKASRPSQAAVNRETSDEVLVDVYGLNKTFQLGSGRKIKAISDVSFQVRRGETFGLVGESGSGKSTVARAVLALTRVDSGRVDFRGNEIHVLNSSDLRSLRRSMQMVFQDPFSSLNRRQTVSQIIEAPLIAHGIGTRAERRAKVAEMLGLVGLGEEFADRYPRTMSGGQCQRVSIARSLILDPDFMVLDESVSALDVSIQAQVLNLLRDLQHRLGLTYLFISHDLAVIRYMADHIAVMRQGVVVELAARDELYSNPQHEYTRSLMAAIPVADPTLERARRKTAAQLAGAYESVEAQ